MAKKKEELGKGLRALLGNIDKADSKPKSKSKTASSTLAEGVAEIPIKNIEANPYQPRKEFKKNELLELVQSIKTLGLIQPITIRSLSKDKYQIISGERRWRASKLAGLKTVPAYIRTADDQGMLEMALVENIQRSNLNALEIAISYQRLIEECDLQHDEMAKRVGKERSTISNYIRLLKLPPDIQSGLKDNSISMGHARALLSIDDPLKQLHIFKRIKDENLSVRNTEKIIRDLKSDSPASKIVRKSPNMIHPEVRRIQERLRKQLDSKVEINRSNKGKGKITIYFNSDDQFNDIVDALEE